MSEERYSLMEGDNMGLLSRLPGDFAHCVVTDPPYGMGEPPDALSMLKDWVERGHHDHKGGGGFMQLAWDSFVPQPAFWREVYRVMRPGAYGVAFASTRTADLMGLSIRLAGFEIRDQLAWCYASGFPKGQNVSKAIDRRKGATREVVGVDEGRLKRLKNQVNGSTALDGQYGIGKRDVSITAPATEEAAEWDGWNTALKPAYEPIILFQKPFKGTVAENVLKWHTGALNIEACRVEGEPGITKHTKKRKGAGAGWHPAYTGDVTVNNSGRYPANFIHDGSDEVLGMFPESNGQQGDLRGHNKTMKSPSGIYGTQPPKRDAPARLDSGSAARFFYCAKPSQFERKLGAGDTQRHQTVKPVALMDWLCKLLCPPGGTILDPFMGSGTTGIAAMLADPSFRFVGMEMDPNHFRRSANRMRWWRKYAQFILAREEKQEQKNLFD